MIETSLLKNVVIFIQTICDFLPNRNNIQPPRHLAQLSIWMSEIGILDIETQLNPLKIKWIQRLLNTTNALRKNLILYQLNLILNYIQGLTLFRQKQILRSASHKNLHKQNNNNFFIQLFNAWLNFANNNFPAPMSVKDILDQTHIFKSKVQTDNLFSIASHPGVFLENLLLSIRYL